MHQHDQGRFAIEKEFGSKIKTTYVENVPESADAERVIRQLAADGNQLLFTTSFGYMGLGQYLVPPGTIQARSVHRVASDSLEMSPAWGTSHLFRNDAYL